MIKSQIFLPVVLAMCLVTPLHAVDHKWHVLATLEAMNRASVEWIQRLLACEGVPWEKLKNYEVKTIPERRWLRQTDANVITTIATLADHWDGPGQHVFSEGKVKDSVQAGALLSISLSDYSASLSYPLVESNKYRLPTPNWVGYYAYHLEKDISAGLLPLRDFK